MMCLMTERRLVPGAFDAFREAWGAGEDPKELIRAYHLRAAGDPDHVISFGFFDAGPDDVAAMMSDPASARMQRDRVAGMAPLIESLGVDEMFEVVEVVEGPSGG